MVNGMVNSYSYSYCLTMLLCVFKSSGYWSWYIFPPRVHPWCVHLHCHRRDDGQLQNPQLHKSIKRKNVWNAGILDTASRDNYWRFCDNLIQIMMQEWLFCLNKFSCLTNIVSKNMTIRKNGRSSRFQELIFFCNNWHILFVLLLYHSNVKRP